MKIARFSPTKPFGKQAFALFLVCLCLTSLACAQAGEILTPAEATARASISTVTPTARQNTPAVTLTPSQGGNTPDQETASSLQVGDEVYLAGKGYLINMVDTPGGVRIVGSQERGAKVTVRELVDLNGQTWVRILAPGGEGWVKVENLSETLP